MAIKLRSYFSLLVFGVSLQSYYFYGIGMPIISVLCLVATLLGIVFLVEWHAGIMLPAPVSSGYLVPFTYISIFVTSAIAATYFGDNIAVKRIFGFIIIASSLLSALVLSNRYGIKSFVEACVALHMLPFYLQLISFYFFGKIVDVLEPITGEAQRMIGGSYVFPGLGAFIRPAGFHNEPGTYATFYAPFLALYARYYTSSLKNKWIFWLGYVSLLLSFSTYAIAFAVIIIVGFNHIKIGVRLLAIVCSALAVLPYIIYRFVIRVSEGLDSGLELRVAYIERVKMFLASDYGALIFGNGLLTGENRITVESAVNDMSLLLFLVYSVGIFVSFIVVFALIYAALRIDRYSAISIVIMLSSKMSLFAPISGFMLVFALYREKLNHRMQKQMQVGKVAETAGATN